MGPQTSGRSIAFDMAGAPRGYGMPVGDLTAYSNNRLSQVIVNGNDQVFSEAAQKRRIIFRIAVSLVILSHLITRLELFQWPGYEALDWAQNIDLMPMGRPITRSQLAAVIAQCYSAYISVHFTRHRLQA
jgi:hypothetical protein